MPRVPRYLAAAALLQLLAACAPAVRTAQPVGFPPPAEAFIHAHNDYEHPRPLFEALDAHALSIEADVHLINNELLVAHDAKDAKPDRTLRSLYLDPLEKRIAAHGGTAYGDGRSIILLIDIKGAAAPTYARLREILATYGDILTRYPQGRPPEFRAVTVILTGNEPPRETIAQEPTRLVAFDGTLADLDAATPASPDLVPLISGSWKLSFKWNGKGAPPAGELKRLDDLARRAHAQGRTIRFWSAPDTPAFWQRLVEADVDWINTDHLPEAAAFLKARRAVVGHP